MQKPTSTLLSWAFSPEASSADDDNETNTFSSLFGDMNLLMSRFSNKVHFSIYFCLAFVFVGSLLLPVQDEHLSISVHQTAGVSSYFSKFEGLSECQMRATSLYHPPSKGPRGFYEADPFCHNRQQLLSAMSEGGRIGFDAPYQPRGCRYRWFDVEEVCIILDRFDSLVFIGDEFLQNVYSGLNILLRQDLALGALDLNSMRQVSEADCRCNHQFVKQKCRQHHVHTSDGSLQENALGSRFFCNRMRHALLRIDTSEVASSTMDDFQRLVPKVFSSKYRPVPIIHSVNPSTMSATDASTSLSKFVTLADDSGRNTPMLWIGPTAAGHVELKGRKGNQEIWEFDRRMAATAAELDVEVLGMWNMTAQATSWDGMHFGEAVAITQAMMVVNWLSRLESS